MDGLQSIHGLVQQEGGVVDQHAQEAEEVGVITFVPVQEGRGRGKTCDPSMYIRTDVYDNVTSI